MIPVWTECTGTREAFPHIFENCIFCEKPTDTWHENTNNPVCVTCAGDHKVADITEDWGSRIRYMKRIGTFDRNDSVRAN